MKDKNTFVIFNENKEYIDQLSDAQAGRLFKAVFAYEEDGTVPDFSDDLALSITFSVIRKQLDYMDEQYDKKSAARSEAGKKGMASRWNNDSSENGSVITNDNNVITKNNNAITGNNKNNLSESVSESLSLSANADKNILSGRAPVAVNGDGSRRRSAAKEEKFSKEIDEIVGYLNTRANKNYFTRTKPTRDAIRARLEEGHTVEDFKRCIDNKAAQWLGTENEKYLRPETLFSPKHFDSYKNELPIIVTQGGSPPELRKVNRSMDPPKGKRVHAYDGEAIMNALLDEFRD
jgi:uncharacterized phage protein (TIGR02220 family)